MPEENNQPVRKCNKPVVIVVSVLALAVIAFGAALGGGMLANRLALTAPKATDSIPATSVIPGSSAAVSATEDSVPTATPEEAVETPDPEPTSPYGDSTVIDFKDKQVEAQIRKILEKPKGDITAGDMAGVTDFTYDNVNDKTAKGVIKTLDDLKYCYNLRTVSVLNQPVRSLEAFRGLPSLQNVDIMGCSVSDLSPLAGKELLTDVWISGNPVSDASPVFSLPNLRRFNAMWGTNIRDISALKSTSSLQEFFCQNKLNDYTPLYEHTALQCIALSNVTNDQFVALLSHLKSLTYIEIQNSKLQDASLSLLKDYNLYLLILDNCGIKDISALSSLTGLNDLRLTNDNITDITPLASLTQLAYCLDLRGNHIKDYSALKGMTLLQSLCVSGNPVTNDKTLKALEKGGCRVQRDH